MKIETSKVTRIRLTELENLDPITVICENFSPGQGKIHIECFGQSWSSFWPAMGDRTIAEFFCSCDEHYLAKNLASNIPEHVDDEDGLQAAAKVEIIRMRKEIEISADEARDLFNSIDLDLTQIEGNHDLLYSIFGDEWWYCIPKKPNHEYVYLCRIINAVKLGLKG